MRLHYILKKYNFTSTQPLSKQQILKLFFPFFVPSLGRVHGLPAPRAPELDLDELWQPGVPEDDRGPVQPGEEPAEQPHVPEHRRRGGKSTGQGLLGQHQIRRQQNNNNNKKPNL